jgi:CHAT domain-containing protein
MCFKAFNHSRRSISLMIILLGGAYVGVGYAFDQQTLPADSSYQALVQHAEQLRDAGDVLSAKRELDQAEQLAQQQAAPTADCSAIALAQGYTLFLLDQKDAAQQKIRSVYSALSPSGYLRALADQYLALLSLSDTHADEASLYIKDGLQALHSEPNPALQLSLQLMDPAQDKRTTSQRAEILLAQGEQIAALPNQINKALLAIKLAQQIIGLNRSEIATAQYERLSALSGQLLAIYSGVNQSDIPFRLQIEAQTKLAELYHWQGNRPLALTSAHQVAAALENSNQFDLSAQIAALQGEWSREQGDAVAALAFYQQAVSDLSLIQAELPIRLADGRSTLKYLIDPIHRNYVDLLLQQPQSDANLALALQSMEEVKQADLQDYYLSRCAVFTTRRLQWTQPVFHDAIIFYPIILPDRVELILRTPQNLIRVTSKVSQAALDEQLDILQSALQSGKDYRAAAHRIYDWLIKPIQTALKQSTVTQIVYIPDGKLRAVPLAALHDGKGFLVEQYAIATLPGLMLESLFANNSKSESNLALLAGLSKPNPDSLDRLPIDLLGAGSAQSLNRENLIEELSLPNVEKEISLLPGGNINVRIINNGFTFSTLKKNVDSGSFNKVHIASHGYFGNTAKDSFIMAYDKNVNLIDFRSIFDSEQLLAKPIQLLTLSACQTAQSNDRMLLGFGGLAVKTNVLSAIGSLWSVNDQATMEFMGLFYSKLEQGENKAQAVQSAQVAMLKNKQYKHPFFWSPFILIGNWH